MDGADLNAFGMLAMLMASLLLLVRFGSRSGLRWTVVAGKGGAMVGLALGIALVSAHGCGAGQPLLQWLLAGLCGVLTWVLLRPRWLGHLAAGVAVVAGLALSLHYDALVHQPRYVGNPEWAKVGLDEDAAAQVTVKRAWHTWLTGVYEVHGRAPAGPPAVREGRAPGAD